MTDDRRTLDLAILTDEVDPDLGAAFDAAMGWGLTRFELREGAEGRFPFFTTAETRRVEQARSDGARITAVSPGLFKGPVADEDRLRRELEVLPRAVDLAVHFGAPCLVLFGFARYDGEPEGDRLRALRVFELAAEAADAAGLIVALENEPRHWIDRPESAVTLLEELGHPALRLNWDPANLHWGGRVPTPADVLTLAPFLANVHVKDYYPARPEAPWLPVGEGDTPWGALTPALRDASGLGHLTIETHCTPLLESSRRSLDALLRLLEAPRFDAQDYADAQREEADRAAHDAHAADNTRGGRR